MEKVCLGLNYLCSCLLGITLLKLYPQRAKLIDNVVRERDFYLDFDIADGEISENDFERIETEFFLFVAQNPELKLQQTFRTKSELKQFYQDNPHKKMFVNGLTTSQQYVYFFDKWPEVLFLATQVIEITYSADNIKHLKLLSVSGVYPQADVSQKMVQRICGAAFETTDSFQEYTQKLDQIRSKDHRRLNQSLDIFTINPLIGSGLISWLENGFNVCDLIKCYITDLQKKHGFRVVKTPVLGNVELYKKSGHWEHYRENMFPVMKVENEQYVLRPMTCPHHVMLFKENVYSYRQLPVRYAEAAILHRYEYSGGLIGLERVRSMELLDNHLFVAPNQILAEIKRCYNMIKVANDTFGIKFKEVHLALCDPNDKEKFHHDDMLWAKAEQDLKQALKELGIDYVEKVGDAAFYGPKIDFQVQTVMHKIITVATIQLDFLLPNRFGLNFKNDQGNLESLVMIHCGIIGTLERFMSVLIEQNEGILPFWLAPVQLILLGVGDNIDCNFIRDLQKELIYLGFRVEIDITNERLAKKVLHANKLKIPYQVFVGEQEINHPNTINYRQFNVNVTKLVAKDEFIKQLQMLNQPKNRVEFYD